ncbi:MAG: hypothetical protein SGPRY_001591 [Prymnesium sp.]
MSAADAAHAPALIKILQEAKQKPPLELQKMALIMGNAGKGAPIINTSGPSKSRGLYD